MLERLLRSKYAIVISGETWWNYEWQSGRESTTATECIGWIVPTENIDVVNYVNGPDCICCLTDVASFIVGLNHEKRMRVEREEIVSDGYGVDH